MKINKAVALKYDSDEDNAPKILASGKGKVADKIIQKAKEYDLTLFANKELVDSLINLDIDTEIPPQLYQAVVEVFIWLAKQNEKGFK